MDVVELDAASNNRVDDMRELVPRVYTAAADLRRKVFIIDEVQRIKEGWDVLLKTLEEPPDGVLFIFCTTDPSQIRPAVVSRLQRFTFRPLSIEEIEGKLGRILASEGRVADADALALIARLAAGGMRDAESLLDQVLATSDAVIDAGLVRDLLGLAPEAAIERFVDALAEGDALAGIEVLDQLEGEGRDLVAFTEQVVVRSARTAGGVPDRPGTARAGTAALAARRASADRYRRQPQWAGRLSLAAGAGAPCERVSPRASRRTPPVIGTCSRSRRRHRHGPRAPSSAAPSPPRRPSAGRARTARPAPPARPRPRPGTGPSHRGRPRPRAPGTPTPGGASVAGDLLADILASWPADRGLDRTQPAHEDAGHDLPTRRGPRRHRHPRLPGGPAIPAREGGAAPTRPRGRHRARPRPAGRGTLREHQHGAAGGRHRGRTSTWSPRHARSSVANSRTSATSAEQSPGTTAQPAGGIHGLGQPRQDGAADAGRHGAGRGGAAGRCASKARRVAARSRRS